MAAYEGTLSASNGAINGAYAIIGGTGRFAHATGLGTTDGVERIDFATGQGSGQIQLKRPLFYEPVAVKALGAVDASYSSRLNYPVPSPLNGCFDRGIRCRVRELLRSPGLVVGAALREECHENKRVRAAVRDWSSAMGFRRVIYAAAHYCDARRQLTE
jgi:hypothetical protein